MKSPTPRPDFTSALSTSESALTHPHLQLTTSRSWKFDGPVPHLQPPSPTPYALEYSRAMALLFKLGTARSLLRARDGPATLAGLRSTAVAPWAAIRQSSNLSADEFIKQVVKEKQENPQDGTDPSSSSTTHVDPGPTPTQSAKPKPSPSIKIKKIAVRFRTCRNVGVENSIEEPQRNEAGKQLVRARPAEPLARNFPVSDDEDSESGKGTAHQWNNRSLVRKIPDSLMRKFPISGKKNLSRPRIVVLRDLPPGTTAGDIIQALERAVDSNRLPYRAWRMADVQAEPRSGEDDEFSARLEFLHPDGARAVHDLVNIGHLQVRGVVPTSSLARNEATPKLSGDSGLGIKGSGQDRRRYFASPVKQKIVRRTPLIYN